MDSNDLATQGYALQAARRRAAAEGRRAARRANRDPVQVAVIIIASVLSVIVGIVMAASNVAHGNDGFSGQDPTTGNVPAELLGGVLIALPFLIGAIWLAVQVIRETARAYRQYRTWKAGLSPEDRAKVELAETAAIWGGAAILHEHRKATSARLASSVMGRTMPDGVTPRYGSDSWGGGPGAGSGPPRPQ
jgi:hypothetical protein